MGWPIMTEPLRLNPQRTCRHYGQGAFQTSPCLGDGCVHYIPRPEAKSYYGPRYGRCEKEA